MGMKKVFLFFGLVLFTTVLSAQQLYNGNFELWSSFTNPDGWGTWATAVGQFNGVLGDSLGRLVMKDSLDHANYPNDTFSVRMTVDTITMPSQGQVTLAGFIAYGGAFYIAPPDTPAGLHFGYYPYTKKPDSLIFDYKYIPAAGYNDTALVVMTMNRFDSASQSEVMYLSNSWVLDTTSFWTHVSIPIMDYYLVNDTFLPDSIQLIVFSSVASHLHMGTTLWLDTIHFDASVDIIIDTFPLGLTNIQNIKGVKAYPNPANDMLNILVQPSEVGSSIELYDAEGRKVYSGIINSPSYAINTQHLSEGVYSIRVNSTDRLTIYSGRVTVVHSQ